MVVGNLQVRLDMVLTGRDEWPLIAKIVTNQDPLNLSPDLTYCAQQK
jgi:hypothetical protein